jgi:5'-3' exonuclease
MLLDTASLYYRAYYGLPETLTSPRGEPVNAIRGVLDMTARLIADRHPTRLAACLDIDWRPEWRVALLPTYKTHRVLEETDSDGEGGEEITPDTLAPQIPVLFDVLEAFGFALAGAEEFEADDVIATLAHREPGPTEVVTGDRDLFQLVDDQRAVRVLYTSKGVARIEVVDEAWILREYGVPAHHYAAFATLRGDASDGLPGVRGIGAKTAASLIQSHGGIDAIITAAGDAASPLSPSVRAKVLAGVDYLAVAPRVVECATDVPLEDLDLAIHPDRLDLEAIGELRERWGLGASTDRLLAVIRGL